MKKNISFGGFNWNVRTAWQPPLNPGPNYFSDNIVSVDQNGNLILKITHWEGRWYCSQIDMEQSLGYGTYIFTVQKGYQNLDINTVIALFIYESDTKEIDIEISKWGNPNSHNTQYVVQPPDHTSVSKFTHQGGFTSVVHAFTWTSQKVLFQSFAAQSINEAISDIGHPSSPNNMINQWTYYGPKKPMAGKQIPIINFWLVDGKAPTNGQQQKVVIKQFKFIKF